MANENKVITRGEINELREGTYSEDLNKAVLFGDEEIKEGFKINPINSVSNIEYTANQALLEADIELSGSITVTLTPSENTIHSTASTATFTSTYTSEDPVTGDPVWSILSVTYNGGEPTSASIDSTTGALTVTIPENTGRTPATIEARVKMAVDGNEWTSNKATVTQNASGYIEFSSPSQYVDSTATTATETFTTNCTEITVSSADPGVTATVSGNQISVSFPTNTEASEKTIHVTVSGKNPDGNTVSVEYTITQGAAGVEHYLTVSPSAATINSNGQVQLQVLLHTIIDGVPSPDTTDVTSTATYTESSPYFNVTNGNVTGMNQQLGGQGTIDITYQGASGTTTSITVKPRNGTVTVECVASEWHVSPESGEVEFNVSWENLMPNTDIELTGLNADDIRPDNYIAINGSNYTGGTEVIIIEYSENLSDTPRDVDLQADAQEINGGSVSGHDWYEQAGQTSYTYGLVITPNSLATQNPSGTYSFTATYYTYGAGGSIVDSEDVTEDANCTWSVSTSSPFVLADVDEGDVEWLNKSDQTQTITVSAEYAGESDSVTFTTNHGTVNYSLTISPVSSQSTYPHQGSEDFKALLWQHVTIDGQEYVGPQGYTNVTNSTTFTISSPSQDFTELYIINNGVHNNGAVWRHLGSSSTTAEVSGTYGALTGSCEITISGVDVNAYITIEPVDTVSCLDFNDTLTYDINVFIEYDGTVVFRDNWSQPLSNSNVDFESSNTGICDVIQIDTVQNVNTSSAVASVTLTATFSENDATYLLPGTVVTGATSLCCKKYVPLGSILINGDSDHYYTATNFIEFIESFSLSYTNIDMSTVGIDSWDGDISYAEILGINQDTLSVTVDTNTSTQEAESVLVITGLNSNDSSIVVTATLTITQPEYEWDYFMLVYDGYPLYATDTHALFTIYHAGNIDASTVEMVLADSLNVNSIVVEQIESYMINLSALIDVNQTGSPKTIELTISAQTNDGRSVVSNTETATQQG